MNHFFNPWHHVPIGNNAPKIVKAIIEIPKGSKGKYELDKETGLLNLNRVLFSAVHYPANYGLIPQTYYLDDDPLDILVFCAIDLLPLATLDARVVGVLRMKDECGPDEKIIAVAGHDPAFAHIRQLKDFPKHTLDEIKKFFMEYKILENRQVEVGEFFGQETAWECIETSRRLYNEKLKLQENEDSRHE